MKKPQNNISVILWMLYTLSFETRAPICLELIDSSRLVNPGNSLGFPSQH